jgi:two-component system, chemotaxis family, CheB/CheR fusion protein
MSDNNLEQEENIALVNEPPADCVIISSSISNIDTLTALIKNLPTNLKAPVILAQPLDPLRSGNRAQTLQRHTSLTIEVVTDKAPVQPGKLLIVPSNRHIRFNHGYIEIVRDEGQQGRPTIDTLFSTASEIYRERLIAVILSWVDSEGAAGAIEVKNNGGTIIIQNPATSRYPTLPLALPPNIVDFVSDADHIGELLQNLLSGEIFTANSDTTELMLRHILEQVSERSSLDFRAYKTTTILRRIGRRISVTQQRDMTQYSQFLDNHPEEIGELVKAFLINVTEFFRDADAFTYLKTEILPVLIERARDHNRVLRFWSAGCASGEEPYSLAMLLSDLLGSELPEWTIKIFATDLDETAINFARRGFYSESHVKGVPQEYLQRYFEPIDQGYRISKMLRQMVVFGQQDLSRSAPFPRIDFVLCRNVLIYFTSELQDFVLNQFAFSLAANGYLFLGKAETVRPNQSHYEIVNKNWKIYRCRGTNVSLSRRLPTKLSIQPVRPQRLSISRPIVKVVNEPDVLNPRLGVNELRRFNELLLRFLPVGVVIIDRSYNLLTANGAARRLLGLHDTGNEQDFLHAVRGIPYAEVRNSIDKVFMERGTVVMPEVELSVATGGNGRFVALSVAIMQMQVDAGMLDLVIISISDVTEQVQTTRQLEQMQNEQTKLMNELSGANQRLNNMNEELLDSNEELQIANEELVLTHEELQATIEEFETTHEELQATNEELETNNEELQATNEELQTTNDELRARTAELQELANLLERERVRLTDFIELRPSYIAVLRGPDLILEAYNPYYTQSLEGLQIQGRPLEEVYEFFREFPPTLVTLAREVYQRDVEMQLPSSVTSLPNLTTADGHASASFSLVPSHDNTGKVNGVIIYLSYK